MPRWINPYGDHYQTECGAGRIRQDADGYCSMWIIKNDKWVSIKTPSGRTAYKKLLSTAKKAVEDAMILGNLVAQKTSPLAELEKTQ